MYGWSKYRFVPQYRSQASFAVDTSTSSVMGDGSLVMEQIKESLPYVLTSEHMKNMVCSELKLDSFPASIEVSANEYANLFTLTVTAGDPNLSNEILQSLLDNFPRASVYVMGRVSLKTLDVSGVPTEPYNSRECIQNAERGAICGLALSVIFVFIRSLYSKTVCDPEDFKKNLNLTCIAAVPHIEFKKRRRSFDRHVHIHNEKVGFGFTESFRTMRIRTERECAKRGDRCIFVTSSISGEGKSTVASNIALALASKGRRVILLDCDFRNPSVVKTLGLDIGKRPGIADVLSGKAAVPEALMYMENWGLDVIPGTVGRSEPASLIGSGRLTKLLEHLKKVFGLVGICPVVRMEDKGFEELKKDVVAYMDEMYPDKNFTFKVESRRAKKSYPLNSMEISRDLGEAILYAFPESGIKVDVHHPDVMVNVEVRNEIYVYSQIIPGAGGMPVGTNGSAMLLLSGGIDSPVAGYMVSKRGVSLEATYFHAPPYTSERAKQKVVDLAKKVAKYSGPIKLHVVNFTDIQLYIYDQCPHDELTIIMRRYMMRIAEHFAKEDGCLGMITGESIGQVASQTMQSLAATNDVCTMPVYRPLIGFDKQEIVDVSEKIDTYETSIQPFEDCCTIFVAKHPVTKPNIDVIRRSEENLNEKIDELMKQAIETVEIIEVK